MARAWLAFALLVCAAHAMKPAVGTVKELGEGVGAGAELQQKLEAEQARSAALEKQLHNLKSFADGHTANLRKRLDAERSEREKLQDKLGLPHHEPLGDSEGWGLGNMFAQGTSELECDSG